MVLPPNIKVDLPWLMGLLTTPAKIIPNPTEILHDTSVPVKPFRFSTADDFVAFIHKHHEEHNSAVLAYEAYMMPTNVSKRDISERTKQSPIEWQLLVRCAIVTINVRRGPTIFTP